MFNARIRRPISAALPCLLQATASNYELLTPHCEAARRVSPSALVASTVPAADMVAHAVGTEHLTGFNVPRSSPPTLVRWRRQSAAHVAQQGMLAVGALPRLYLHWEFYQPGMENMGKQMSPLHFLKLKKGGLAAMLGGSVMAWPGLAVGCTLLFCAVGFEPCSSRLAVGAS